MSERGDCASNARGVKLGKPNGGSALRGKQAVAAVKANAEHRAANLRAIVDDLRSQGFTSVRTIAAQLNARQGFGSQLLKGIFSEVSLEYPVEGLRCEIEVHLVAASKRVSPQGSQTEPTLQDDAVVDG